MISYKLLYNTLPTDVVNHIASFNNTSKLNMNNVIKEINHYIDKVREYWEHDEFFSNEERCGLSIEELDWPYPSGAYTPDFGCN
jgi:hypothetical protein